MSAHTLLRGFFAAIMAAALAFAVETRYAPAPRPDARQGQNASIIAPLLLPAFLAVLLAASLIVTGPACTAQGMLSLCFGLFLQISAYDLVLLLLLPLLRRWISARVCALLWLLPNYLYLIAQPWMRPDAPKLVLKWDGGGILIALAVWAAGFAAVLLWKTAGHLAFRRQLLRDARDVTDGEILALWREEQARAGLPKQTLRLAVSSRAASPLSIGMCRAATRVILPEKEFTPEDLTLIFRHELIHIQRGDSRTKFFLVFCTAMCWFNPLMWIAMRRSAEDLELSCDEAVLCGAGEALRRRYALLILSAAGDERGYTTCLSASASALRYRLKQIMKPRRRLIGGAAAGVLFFALLLSSGYVALAYGGAPAGELVFGSQTGPTAFSFQTVTFRTGETQAHASYTCKDPAALTGYLSGLRLYRLTGSYDFPDSEHQMTIFYQGPQTSFYWDLSDRALTVTLLGEERRSETYYLFDAADWAYIEALLEPYDGAALQT